MSNKDTHKLENILTGPFSFRVNRMFNNKVHDHWGFKDRINLDQHLIYVKGGEGFYIVDGREIPLVRGHLIFVSRGTLHTAGFRGENNPRIIPVRFSIYDGNGLVDNAITRPFSLIKNLKQRDYIESLMNKLFKLSTNQNPGPLIELQMDSLLRLALSLLLEEDKSVEIRDTRIADALNKIHGSPWKKHNLNDLASLSNLSTKQFSRLFRKETNRSPIDYIRYFRCQYAAEELDSTSRSVQNIAIDFGYPDPYTFSKQFKKYMGLSPRQWRLRERLTGSS